MFHLNTNHYFLNYQNDNIKKKKIAPFLPIFLKKIIAKQIHSYQLNYWVHYLKRKYPYLYLEIAKKIDRQSLESHAKINYKFLKKLID